MFQYHKVNPEIEIIKFNENKIEKLSPFIISKKIKYLVISVYISLNLFETR